MNKINNITTYKIISSLGILAILVFGIAIMSTKANAQQYEYGRGPKGTGTGALGGYVITSFENNNSSDYQAPNDPTPTIYSYSTNPNTAKNAPKTVAEVKTDSPANTPAVATGTSNNPNLAANAIFGSNSFKPSGLIQWVFFAIIILLMVILVRKIFGGKEKYLAIPMKHD